jgi:hypothetical protein
MDTKDRLEILDVISRCSHFYDESRIDALVDLFDHDAVTNILVPGQSRPFHTTTTLPQLRDATRDRRALLAGKGIQTRHILGGTILTELAQDQVRGCTPFLVAWQREGTLVPRIMHSGTYEDEFRRTPRGWRIVRRDLRLDHEVPTHPLIAHLRSWIPRFRRLTTSPASDLRATEGQSD